MKVIAQLSNNLLLNRHNLFKHLNVLVLDKACSMPLCSIETGRFMNKCLRQIVSGLYRLAALAICAKLPRQGGKTFIC
ncbi:hypothetical protein HX881_03310 [Pseudomonas gingeri]|uniref:hypothetical protein n=1 Tax=Pseudomonas gingeri TaxID=117681 RepID=UPI0015A2BA51|nr:hypothetical protein [Pseudomonas gingeri]NVZ24563.1 hypothetical protein [Pseudomonas gingeri]